MPERGRHHPNHRSDVYAESQSRDTDDDERRSAWDNTSKHKRQGDMTRASDKPNVRRDHRHPGPSRASGDSEERFYEPHHKAALYNFRYILTSRGLCQLMEVFVNLLLIVCAGVTHSNNGGYRDLASLGGIYHYHFGGANAFTGAAADRVKELDQLFHQLKRPPYAFTMACGGVLMVYALAMFALGIFRVPYRCPPMLLGEALLNLLIGLGYIPGLAFFFIKLQETYANPVCTEREQLYKSKGHKGFECQFHGADIACGLFGALGVFVFIFGAVLAVRAFRSLRQRKTQRTNEDENFEAALARRGNVYV